MNIKAKNHLKHINIKIYSKIKNKKLFIPESPEIWPKHLEIFIDTFQWYFLYQVEYQNSILREFQPELHEIDYFD